MFTLFRMKLNKLDKKTMKKSNQPRKSGLRKNINKSMFNFSNEYLYLQTVH